MLILEIFVSLWLNECDGYVPLQDPNFVTVTLMVINDIRVKSLAACNSLEPGELFQKFEVNINFLVNFLFKLTSYRASFG